MSATAMPFKERDTAERLKEEVSRRWELLSRAAAPRRARLSERALFIKSGAFEWMGEVRENSIHAVVTDPPYGLIEYEEKNREKLRSGKGGVWRIPPSFDGAKRRPVPRFTVLTQDDVKTLRDFFEETAKALYRVLVPGGHVVIASNPLLSTSTFNSFIEAGFEKRGEIIRLVQTLRGGDRPKNAEEEFPFVTVMPRSCFEPWGVFRKPLEGTVAENLRRWGTGGLRRTSESDPFKDVLECAPARPNEHRIAPHPSLKPQRLMRQITRAVLPLGLGIVYDPFAGSGATLAACEHIGYYSVGTDRDEEYFDMARRAFPRLSSLAVKG